MTRVPRMARTLGLAAAIGLPPLALLPGVQSLGQAQSTTTVPLELRSIMQEMRLDLQATVEAISLEDWERVAAIAPRIADHRRPSADERTQILALLGPEAIRFKGADDAVHDAAETMGTAAGRKDGPAVIAAFAAAQNACLSCHQAFRQKIVGHFYRK